MSRRGLAAGAGLVAAATVAAITVRRRGPLHSRAGRNLALAQLGGRLGRRQAAHQARRVFASAERREELDREHELRTAADVAGALGNMKGALMKLGQLASFLDDGLPAPMREALASLQQDAPPMSGSLAAEVVAHELGASPDQLFAEWDPTPIAAASIGQVHRAITHDGQAVAVKVQYPGVDRAIRTDLDNTQLLVQAVGMMFPGLDPGPIVDELKTRLTEELDYRLEAKNQRLFAAFYDRHPFIHVPAVRDDLSSERVLTTELATGAR
ncbi:MAG TPA: AarF/UbiB family protein, partial [Acidimicrobiales bacterium]|nr:AarF/UbiB family protein [Acidimicrobiales bacterium]